MPFASWPAVWLVACPVGLENELRHQRHCGINACLGPKLPEDGFMLEFFRQHVSGMFGITLVGLLAVAFALSFGSQSRGWGSGQSGRIVAEVEGIEIDDRTIQYAANLLGARQLGNEDAQGMRLRRIALEGLVERALLISLAQDGGITASLEETEERVARNEIFLTRPVDDLVSQVQGSVFYNPQMAVRALIREGHRISTPFQDQAGRFDIEAYRKYIQYHLQYTEESFVEQQRLELIAERMREILAGSVILSESEVHQAYFRENNTATIEYVRLIPSFFSNKLEPTTEELSEWAGNQLNQKRRTRRGRPQTSC
jgi:hypothetical protein